MNNKTVLASLPKEVAKAVQTTAQAHLQKGTGEYELTINDENSWNGKLEMYSCYPKDDYNDGPCGVKIVIAWEMD